MESETIDLTDPLEEFLKQTNWTPECLNERLSFLSEKGPHRNKNTGGNVTLDDLLGFRVDEESSHKLLFESSKPVRSVSAEENTGSAALDCGKHGDDLQPVARLSETIELSDDEGSEILNTKDENVGDKTENVTEVQVIEISDFSDSNEDDDDFFEESSVSKSNSTQDSSTINSSMSQTQSHQDSVLSSKPTTQKSCLNMNSPCHVDESITTIEILSPTRVDVSESTCSDLQLLNSVEKGSSNIKASHLPKCDGQKSEKSSLSEISLKRAANKNILAIKKITDDMSLSKSDVVDSKAANSNSNYGCLEDEIRHITSHESVSNVIITKDFTNDENNISHGEDPICSDTICGLAEDKFIKNHDVILKTHSDMESVHLSNVEGHQAKTERKSETAKSSNESGILRETEANIGNHSNATNKSKIETVSALDSTLDTNEPKPSISPILKEISNCLNESSIATIMETSTSSSDSIADELDESTPNSDLTHRDTEKQHSSDNKLATCDANVLDDSCLDKSSGDQPDKDQAADSTYSSIIPGFKDNESTQNSLLCDLTPSNTEEQHSSDNKLPTCNVNVLDESRLDISSKYQPDKDQVAESRYSSVSPGFKEILNCLDKVESSNTTKMKTNTSGSNSTADEPDESSPNSCLSDLTPSNTEKRHSTDNKLATCDANVLGDGSLDISSKDQPDKDQVARSKYLDSNENKSLDISSEISPVIVTGQQYLQTQNYKATNENHHAIEDLVEDSVQNNSTLLLKYAGVAESIVKPSSSILSDVIELESQDQLISKTKNMEHNVNTQVFSEETTSEDTSCKLETSFESAEEIRKHLKLQLTNLRTRKKIDILQDVKHTVDNIDKLQTHHSFNKRPSNIDILENVKNHEPNVSTMPSRTEYKEVSPPNAQLLNRQGDQIDICIDSQRDEHIPSVFNELRKIIRKSKPSSSPIDHNVSLNIDNVTTNDLRRNESKENPNEILLNKDEVTEKANLQNDESPRVASTTNEQLQSNKTAVSSPFISNTLDEFLIDSKLNVSYTIPKSGAEEGLRMNYSVDPVISYESKPKTEDVEKSKEESKYKPKTLAEKRRIMERNESRKQKLLKKLRSEGEMKKRSYVLFKDKKIFLQSKSIGKCIASVESTMPIPDQSTPLSPFKKPSLLTEFYRKTSQVKYNPGPLCKKHLLQSDYSRWITELKALPTVVLNVMPELGKPVHQNLLPLVCQWSGEVTEDQIEFALTALVPKTDHDNKVFQFDVKYERRQETLVVRKKMSGKHDIKSDPVDNYCSYSTRSNSDKDVAEVIEKLINYVETSEIAPSLIKDDEDFIAPMETAIVSMDSTGKKPDSIKKNFRKLSRTSKELLRLNCKVVTMEEKESEPKTFCSKSYCRLGCVCNSLQCDTMIGLHCRKVKCMFGCSCPKEKNKLISISKAEILVNAGTDFLSRDTVTRIEGEAKRNLAKEEKEFTQTVIYANDKTIVVGVGNKQRRAARAPKKYVDFFDEDSFNEVSSESKKERKVPVKPCAVYMEKLDFTDVIPYCLVHHLYNCFCNGFSDLPSGSSFEGDHANPINENEEYFPNQRIKARCRKRKTEVYTDTINDNELGDPAYSITSRPSRKRKGTFKSDFIRYDGKALLSLDEKVEISKYPIGTNLLIPEKISCSRTREVPKRYRSIKHFAHSVLDFDFCNNITEADLLKIKLYEKEDILDSDRLRISIIKEQKKKLSETTETENRKRQRKQQLEVRQDEDLNINGSCVATPSKKSRRKVNSVFRGEIIVEDAEWLKKLCNNAKQPSDSYARILPWNALIKGFLSKSINVYCICDMPLRLLLNVGEKLTGNKIVDIEQSGHKILEAALKGKAPWLVSQSENVRDIIKWLLSGTLSSKYKSNSLSFLLVETVPGQFEVRGLCTQNDKNEGKKNIEKEGESVLHESKVISDEITEIKHKNMNSEIESLFITKGKYRLRELVEDGFEDDLTDNLYMWVGLPEVFKVAKWRVIFLKDDFVYLYFKHIQYSIKYTDLVKLTEMAAEEKLTLQVRNLQIRRSYAHTMFGLYVSPTYTDRIFIGPYFINYEEDDVETLKYVKESLIRAESYNRMKGNLDHKCGHWMYERPYCHTPKNYPKETIDLTNDDSPVTHAVSSPEKKSSLPETVPLGMPSDEQIITHNGLPVHIKNSKPRSPSEFNRYIMTNIPHFGYLGAFQPDDSSILEVSWPFEKKVLQFENADHARDFLQERFNQLLQPVPETFKIQVIVLIHLDLNENQPINSDFLNGHCICGYFGTYNFKELSDEFCQQKLNMTKEHITKLFAQRAHDYIRKKIAELAEITGIDAKDKPNYNVGSILKKAKEVIKFEEHRRIQQVAEIQSRENRVVEIIKRIFNTIKQLPAKERNIESKILNEILQIRPKRVGVKAVIEIKDDDSPVAKPNDVTQKNEIMVYPKTSQDGPREYGKRKTENETKIRQPKIAKVAPFSSTPVVAINRENREVSDKSNYLGLDEKIDLDIAEK